MNAGSTLQNVIDNEMASSNGRPVACSIPPGVEELISGVQLPDPRHALGIEASGRVEGVALPVPLDSY